MDVQNVQLVFPILRHSSTCTVQLQLPWWQMYICIHILRDDLPWVLMSPSDKEELQLGKPSLSEYTEHKESIGLGLQTRYTRNWNWWWLFLFRTLKSNLPTPMNALGPNFNFVNPFCPSILSSLHYFQSFLTDILFSISLFFFIPEHPL